MPHTIHALNQISKPASRLGLLLMLVSPACQKAADGHIKATTYTRIELQQGQLQRSPAQNPGEQSLAQWQDQIRLIDAKLIPATFAPGAQVMLETRYLTLKAPDRDWTIFVHGQLQDAELNQVQDDHKPLNGQVPTSQWLPGDIIVEQRSLHIPKDIVGKKLDIYLGFYQGKQRMKITQAKTDDGHNRALIASGEIIGGIDKREATANWSDQSPKIDGVLDEASWATAQKLGPFVNYNGLGLASRKTWVRVLYDAEALYLGFDCEDPDAWTSYSKHDDPIYNEEAVEIFIDADADLQDYVEIQTAPNNIHFESGFTGRRQNMDTSYNPKFTTAVTVDGTVNNPDDQDKGWVAEWRIPFDQIRGLKNNPKAGTEWRVNFFRLERVRKNGRVVQNQASAWSSPRSGDFHNIKRFGFLRFGPKPAETSPKK